VIASLFTTHKYGLSCMVGLALWASNTTLQSVCRDAEWGCINVLINKHKTCNCIVLPGRRVVIVEWTVSWRRMRLMPSLRTSTRSAWPSLSSLKTPTSCCLDVKRQALILTQTLYSLLMYTVNFY